jgi:hypothetical protein
LFVIVKLCLPVRAIAVEARTDALPKAEIHGEGVANRRKLLSVDAIPELMVVLHTVVSNTKVELVVLTRLDDFLLSPKLSIDTLRTEANRIKMLANTEEAGIAVARGFDDGCALALITHDLLRQHITAEFEAVGRLGVDGQIAFALAEAPVGVVRVVVPLPLETDGIGEIIAVNVVQYFQDPKNSEIVDRLIGYGLQMSIKEETRKSNILEGKIIVVSGVFSKHGRKDYEERIIEQYGGKRSSSISNKTSFILAGDNMGPSKLQKAEKLGIPIISEDEFLEMIGYDDDVTASDGSAVGSDDKKPQEPKQLSLF